VSIGPGSYTGLRIGSAFAKSLSYATGIPLVGVPSFEAMVRPGPEGDGPLAPVLDARWNQMYCAGFARDGERRSRLTEDLVGPPEAITARLPAGILYFGPGVPAFLEQLEGSGDLAPPGPWDRIRADTVAAVGRELFALRGPDASDRLSPVYLRPTQAELKRGSN
jgi:tRNA threonylcarbamoyladenosine biosynthesis protein TsaB